VLGVHGSALSNLVYARDCKVIEVFPGPASPEFRVLAAACGHRYRAIVGDGFDRDANLVLRFEEVMRALELMESRPPALLRSASVSSSE
jgi:capsular polysaccharide biosynthesis protein